jgi:chromosome segregation ATPase
MDHSQPIIEEAVQENQADPEATGQKRELKERYFLTRKELRESQRLLALRDEELRKLRLNQRREVEQSHEQENLRGSLDRLQSRVDELQRQLTDSRNQLRQARTEAAEKSALGPILEKETSETRDQLEASENRIREISSLLEQRERELQEKNGSLHDVHGIQDRLDQREKDLLEREEELHATREHLNTEKGEVDTARRTAESLTEERVDMASRLEQAESSVRQTDETISMLQEKLMESGEELIKQEESVRDYRYLMETLKREKADQEASYAQAVGELETNIDAAKEECRGLQELSTAHQQEKDRFTEEKNELLSRIEQDRESHQSELTALEQTQAREIDKLKMAHASELGETRDSVHRLETDLDASRLRVDRLQSELDELRSEVPRLTARLEDRDRTVTDTRTLLLDALSRLDALDQPSELDLGQEQPPEHAADEMWPAG